MSRFFACTLGYMPQDSDIIATKTDQGTVNLYNLTNPESSGPFSVLTGLTAAGFGLHWSPKDKGHLVSSGADGKFAVWDALGSSKSPLVLVDNYTCAVNDIKFHPERDGVVGLALDDKAYALFDTRANSQVIKVEGHRDEVYCLDFNKHNSFLFATGSKDCTIGLWDMRQLNTQLFGFEHHKESVMRLDWCPYDAKYLLSCSEDNKVSLWDTTRIGDETKDDENTDGPVELVFSHCGHKLGLTDASWNLAPGSMIFASVDVNDNQLQVWQLASDLITKDEIYII